MFLNNNKFIGHPLAVPDYKLLKKNLLSVLRCTESPESLEIRQIVMIYSKLQS